MNINQQSRNNTALESYTSNSERTTKQPKNGFYELGIAPSLIKAINRLKFEAPTPIQQEAIPVGIQGDDIIALAQTGSGKTLAFGIPMLQRLSESKKGIGLVLVPTRELAIQVEESLKTISRPLGIRSAVLIGGASINLQRNVLKKNPRIIIATPGRLMDHIERKTVNLSIVEIFILDEADRMLDMGFVPDIKKIMKSIPDKRQTMLFSATMPKPIEAIAKQFMENSIRIAVSRTGAPPAEVSQEVFVLKNQDKGRLLASHIKQCTGPVLVFTRTKRMATKLSSKVLDMGFAAAEIHSDRSLGQRRNALEGFKKGRYQVLIATDIAARGIDVSGIELVVNYDMPANSEDYVHRIGRTGRAGKKGHAISFATTAQKSTIRDIERFIKTKLTISKLPVMPTEKEFFKEAAHLNLRETLSRDNYSSKRKSSSNRSSNRKFSKDGSSSRREINKREPKDFTHNRFGSRPNYFKNESSSDEMSSNKRYTSERSTDRREFFKSDKKKTSKYRFDSKQRDFKNDSPNDDKTSKRKNFRKDESNNFLKKRTDSKKSSFKRKDSTQQESKRNFSKSRDSQTADSFSKDSTNENPFWSKYAKKKHSKKKSVGQGSGRKKHSKH